MSNRVFIFPLNSFTELDLLEPTWVSDTTPIKMGSDTK